MALIVARIITTKERLSLVVYRNGVVPVDGDAELLFPENLASLLIEAVSGIGSETYSSTTNTRSILQPSKHDHPCIPNYLKQQQAILKTVGTFVAEQCREVGIQVHNPEGGFLCAWISALKKETSLRQKNCRSSVEICHTIY